MFVPVGAPRDLESLRAQEVTLRIQRLQAERGLPDFAAARSATDAAAEGRVELTITN